MSFITRAKNTGIRLLRKLRDILRAIRIAGFTGTINMIRTKSMKSSNDLAQQIPGDDPFGTEPIFRYATCNDLVTLLAQYPQYARADRESDKSPAYGLKSVGTLFCVDRIQRFKPQRVLEVGTGWNTHFDKHFGETLEYWMVDDATDIGDTSASKDRFEQAVRERKHTHFVRGWLGSFLPELPENTFDLVFSISAVEHVPASAKRNFYKDMFRVLKPGGMIAHSIDLADEALARAEFEIIRQTGFLLPKRPDLRIRVLPSEGNPTLFEDFWTVFHAYLGLNRPDKWTNLKQIQGHYPTILVFARKSEA